MGVRMVCLSTCVACRLREPSGVYPLWGRRSPGWPDCSTCRVCRRVPHRCASEPRRRECRGHGRVPIGEMLSRV